MDPNKLKEEIERIAKMMREDLVKLTEQLKIEEQCTEIMTGQYGQYLIHLN